MLLKLAWRNLWRNPRRTIITLLSIMLSVMISVAMQSIQDGMSHSAIDSIIKMDTGHIQIQDTLFKEEPSIDNSLIADEPLLNSLRSIKGVETVIPKVMSGGMAASDSGTRLAIFQSIDEEGQLEIAKKNLVSGRLMDPETNEVVLGSALAEKLQLSIGDSLVMLGQGFRGSTAAMLAPVVGIVEWPSKIVDRRLVYTSLKGAGLLYNFTDRVTSISVMLKGFAKPEEVKKDVEAVLANYQSQEGEVPVAFTWNELRPEILQMKDADKASSVMIFGILYLIVAFGLFGTYVMMLKERVREFGTLIAIGMKKKLLINVVVFEGIIVGILGAFAGMLIAAIPVFLLYFNPVPLPGEVAESMEKYGFVPAITAFPAWSTFVSQTIIVLVMSLVLTMYSVFKISRIRAVDAMRA